LLRFSTLIISILFAFETLAKRLAKRYGEAQNIPYRSVSPQKGPEILPCLSRGFALFDEKKMSAFKKGHHRRSKPKRRLYVATKNSHNFRR